MAQGFYTLEEAAQRLGIPAGELSGMAQRREVRAFADRGTWRFRAQDVEELARQRGVPSDPSVPSLSVGHGHEDTGSSTQEISPFEIQDLTEVMTPPHEDDDAGVDLFASSVDAGRKSAGSDSGLFLAPKSGIEYGTAPMSDPGGRGSAILGGPKSAPPRSGVKPPSSKRTPPVTPPAAQMPVADDDDSVVPIGRESLAGPGDSSVRLDGLSGRLPDSGVRLVDFDDLPGLSGLVAPPSSTRLAPSSKPPTVRTAPDVIAQAPPSGQDLGAANKPPSSAEFDFGTSAEFDLSPSAAPGPSDSVFDLSTPSMESIELQITSDLEDTGSSAIDLERAHTGTGRTSGTTREPGPEADDDSVTFELSMEDEAPARRSGRHQPINSSFELSLDPEGAAASSAEDSSSDFELTLDDSGSSSMEVEDKSATAPGTDDLESSDFELALDDDSVSEIVDDTGSEVVVLEDEERGVSSEEVTPVESMAELAEMEDADLAVVEPVEEVSPATAAMISKDAVPLPADWGWTSLLLVPTTLVMLFTGFLLYEMVRSVWTYQDPTPVSAPVFRTIQSYTK
jgi:excisionase family DNA binding protein